MAGMPEHLCEHHVQVCRSCGKEGDMDFDPMLHCHDDDDHDDEGYSLKVVINQKRECRIHKEH